MTDQTPQQTPQQTSGDQAFAWDKAGVSGEALGYVQNKGWKTPADMLKSYQEFEKTRGVPQERLLTLPAGDKPEDWAPVWDRLGRPKTAKDYAFDVPKNADGSDGDRSFAETAAEWFHKHGAPVAMARGIVKEWNEFVAAETKKVQTKLAETVAADLAALQKEWGGNFDAHDRLAGKAMKAFGIDDATAARLRDAMGTANAIKLFHAIGAKMGVEDRFVGGGGNRFSGAMTADQARARLTEIKSDKAMVDKFAKGDAEVRKEIDMLNAIIAGAASA